MTTIAFPATAGANPHADGELLWYSFPLLERFSDRLCHGFSTRLGGVSDGARAALNLGAGRGDPPELLAENWRRFGAAVGFPWQRAVCSQQTHTANLRLVTAADAGCGVRRPLTYHDVDGLITATVGLPLLTFFADCVPLLFYAADRHLAAASHAGWRGTAAGIGPATVERLISLGSDPSQIYAVIGPSAGPCCYQVDAATADHFRQLSDEDGPVIRPCPAAPGHLMLDLWRANRAQLLAAGLPAANISLSGLCTICHPDIFYSHRVQGPDRGSLAAVIMLSEVRG